MSTMSTQTFAFTLAGLVLLVAAGNAQESRGTIAGRVLDSSGAILAGAEVRATNRDTGAVARARTNADGSYTIPQGNLFPPGTAKTRPEIYTMGHRNPYRISIDSHTGFLYWGDVGPDANVDSAGRGPRGYDGGKKINGRKRHIVVDSMGLLLVCLVTAASADDGTTAPEVLARLTEAHRSRLEEVRGDRKYRNRRLDRYLAESQARYQVTVVERPPGVKGYVHLPYRWVVERTHAWFGKYRRNSKDYERDPASSEAMLQVSMIHLLLRRLKPDTEKKMLQFCYPSKKTKEITV